MLPKTLKIALSGHSSYKGPVFRRVHSCNFTEKEPSSNEPKLIQGTKSSSIHHEIAHEKVNTIKYQEYQFSKSSERKKKIKKINVSVPSYLSLFPMKHIH